MANKRNNSKPGEGTRKRLAEQAVLASVATEKSLRRKAKEAARRREKRAAKKLEEEAAKLLRIQLNRNQALVAEIADLILGRVAPSGAQLGGAIMRAAVLSPTLEPFRLAAGILE